MSGATEIQNLKSRGEFFSVPIRRCLEGNTLSTPAAIAVAWVT
jgi:hypothetical protein